jgi:molybdopterin guanine dinucleotide-containing S/N-oxide reductase-like protein
MKRVVHAACPHDCPDACSVLITVEDGRATRIQGNPDHPVTRGFLCGKVAKYLDRVYSPQRLLRPMRRVAPKGQRGMEAFVPISWDEALDTIAAKFNSIAAEFGPESILPFSYGGTLGVIQGSTMDHRFFHRLGASQLERAICSTAGEVGLTSVLGRKLGTEPEQFRQSRYIIAWGANIHGNNIHLWPFIEEARREGAKLVVIDPYKTRTARVADWHIQIRPGTDVALALGMMHFIFSEGLADEDYITRYTIGSDKLRARAAQYPPERVAEITGISADDIRTLAREYATAKPAAIRMNYGVQRSENGATNVRAIAMLPCITGSWKQVGGGLQLSLSGAFPLNKQGSKRPELMQKSLGRPARVLNMNQLGMHLTEDLEPPVKALFVFDCNPAAVVPNRALVLRGLKRDDLFTVVHEQFLTETCEYADIVLPATTFFEHADLQGSYGHYHLQRSDAAIAPLGEARCNSDVFRALAERMGFTEDCFRQTDEELIAEAMKSDDPWMKGITPESLTEKHSQRLNFNGADGEPYLPFAEGGFATASGKAELYSEAVAQKGFDPVIDFVAPVESRHSKSDRYPLELLARKHDNFMNSTFANLEGHRAMERTGELELHPADAAARNIADGDRVKVFNGRGELHLRARVGYTVGEGVVAAGLDWAGLDGGQHNINVLTSDRLTDMGGGATFYSALVQVEKA